MKKVNYAVLEDMKKYIAGFNPKEYEISYSKTDSAVIEYARDYYDKHLPVDVTAWTRVNEPDPYLIYAKGLDEQVCFVRDTLYRLLTLSYEEWRDNPPLVISTHYSESVKLPVYQINLKKYGIEIVLRYNFYNWIISIKSDKPLDFDYMGLFNPSEVIPEVYCEGIPKDKIYGCYEENHSQFTIDIWSKYDLYTFIFLLKKYLGIGRKK